MRFLFLSVCCFQLALSSVLRNELKIVQSCSNLVYCQGELLEVVQSAKIYNDSKTFVDMSQINPENVTLANFWSLMNQTKGNPSKSEIAKFVTDNFVSRNETEIWTLPDFKQNPAFLEKITDDAVREFAQSLNQIWPTLARKTTADVEENPERHSILPVPNGFVVPGGRFKELYYWDSYWVIKGLLQCEMYGTVKGMLENICHLITKYGFMPNGARLYYLNRSQPPLFTLMIQNYLKSTNDTGFIENIIQCVETEMNFWSDNRTVPVEKDGVTHVLAHYQSSSNTPRPESYSEDVRTCSSFADKVDRSLCYQSLKSGAESGWDFSSRWFFDENGGVDTNLTHIQAQRVIPVDLNAFLCRAFADLADFYKILGNGEKSDYWQERSDIWKKSIQMVLYDEEEGIWFDYDWHLRTARKYFFPSNYAPLWAEVYDSDKKELYGKRAAAYFVNQGVDQYLGGTPTSLVQSGEQWDLTNAWPPLQELVVLGLLKTGNSNATKLASTLADRWISANMLGYEEHSIMFEKYDAVVPGQFGGGGEYTVQAGFGWTNGVAFSFINEFYTDS